MPRPTYTLYAPEAGFRAFATLIAAEYSGVTVAVDTTSTAAAAGSPVNKLPVLQVHSGGTTSSIFSSHAAARYMAGVCRDAGLTGPGSALDAAAVDAWMDWCNADVELPACLWFYPVAGYMAFQPAVYVGILVIVNDIDIVVACMFVFLFFVVFLLFSGLYDSTIC